MGRGERAHQAAEGARGRHRARRATDRYARTRESGHEQRTDHPEQKHWRPEQQRRRDQRAADDRAHGGVERQVVRQQQLADRTRQERQHREQRARDPEHDEQRPARLATPGQHAAQRRSTRERRENDSDDVGPDVGAVTEPRRLQPEPP